MRNRQPIDSIVFDMDGTLWDAVDSYAVIWNVSLDQVGIKHEPVVREELLKHMGSYLDEILRSLIPDVKQQKDLLRLVMRNESAMMPKLGGKLYPAVKELIPKLAEQYRLFMVSNCGPDGLQNFVRYNGFEDYFQDLLSHGGNGKSKTENIELLIDRYQLKSPVYVGDTQSDADSTHKAGIPFVWTAYGFGQVRDADAEIHGFDGLPSAITQINKKIAANLS